MNEPDVSEQMPSTVTAAAFHRATRIRGQALRRSLYFTFIAWAPGAFWVGATNGAPTVELARHLGADDFTFSLLSAVSLLCVLLRIPGLFLVERVGRRKPIFVPALMATRALFIVMGLLPWMLPAHMSWPAMVFILVVAVSTGLGNVSDTAWTSWMADLVPHRGSGKFFGKRLRMGIAVIGMTGICVALLLDLSQQAWFGAVLAPITAATRLPPLIFFISLIFMAAGAVGMVGVMCSMKVDEPAMLPVSREPLLRRLLTPLRDSQFRRYIAYRSVWTVSDFFCQWTWFLYLLDFLQTEKAAGNHAWWENHVYLAAVIILLVGAQIGQFMGYGMWGRAVDRLGCKPVLFLSSTLHSIAWMFWLFLSPALLPWLFVTQIVGGFLFGGQDVASFKMMLQFNRRGGLAYQAVGTILFSVAGAVAAGLSGKLADTVFKGFHWTLAPGTRWEHTFNHYALLIGISIVIKYTADFVFLPAVKEPGDKSAGHALRYVLGHTYGSLNALVLTPLRTGAEIAGRGLIGVRDTYSSIRRRWK